MITNTDCTLYNFNSITQGFDRYYISAVMWQENRAAKVTKQGLQSSDGVNIYIPSENIPDIQVTVTKDILVQGNCDFKFDNSTQQTVSESLKQLKKDYPKYVTVHTVDNKQYGNLPGLSHIKLVAR